MARGKGVSGYYRDGANRLPAVHWRSTDGTSLFVFVHLRANRTVNPMSSLRIHPSSCVGPHNASGPRRDGADRMYVCC